MRISDLPPRFQEQVRRQLEQGEKQPPETAPKTTPETSRKNRGPNKTEQAYRQQVLDRDPCVKVIGYEAITFRMANGHRYTCDWLVADPDGHLTCIEVKGSYRLGSYQRARLAYDQARIEWPMFGWVWVEKTKDGWSVKDDVPTWHLAKSEKPQGEV